ncbi:MAG: undecaprenyl phosphate-alpha-L-ara4FN deformylase [Gammaproteobacteria bacterium]|jgi:peptidoglycan/xylan/chitin deacetylase (PgdA/CDA1 family)|nr:undecaprenyl phosphate-alpha-L-ara4FN deformylase [Gammaproteobacteria bacterium]
MLEGARIGLKVDVDTLRGTREGVPRLAALLKKHGLDATFYFSVGPDHTGRAMRRVFRKGFAQKVARTSVLKHYGLKTLLYGVLLPGPDIGKQGGAQMRRVYEAGFEVGLHTYDHVRWQDYVAHATAAWTRTEFERGLQAFDKVFGFLPQSHAAAGWQINAHALELEREYGLHYASDTRGGPAFFPSLDGIASPCPQLPTTLPTFDELIGRDGIDEENIADEVFERSSAAADPTLQVFTLHAELEGMLLLDAFESLLLKWRNAGVIVTRMADIRSRALQRPLPTRAVIEGEIPGRSGLLAVQASSAAPSA